MSQRGTHEDLIGPIMSGSMKRFDRREAFEPIVKKTKRDEIVDDVFFEKEPETSASDLDVEETAEEKKLRIGAVCFGITSTEWLLQQRRIWKS